MDLQERADHLAALMEERLDIRGQGLAVKYRRAGRRLPRWVAREVAYLLDAMDLAENPKLARQIDERRIETGFKKAEGWLRSQDPWDRRWGILLDWLVGNAFNILVVFGLVFAVLAWRGFI